MLSGAFRKNDIQEFGKILESVHPDLEKDDCDRTTLMIICGSYTVGHDKFVKLLLEKGADPNYETKLDTDLILGKAVNRTLHGGDTVTQIEIVKLLIKYGADINKNPYLLHYAVMHSDHDPDLVKILLQNGVCQSSKLSGHTALEYIKNIQIEGRFGDVQKIFKIVELLEKGWKFVEDKEFEEVKKKDQQKKHEALMRQEQIRIQLEERKKQDERRKKYELKRHEYLKKDDEIKRLEKENLQKQNKIEEELKIRDSILTLAIHNLEFLEKMKDKLPDDVKVVIKRFISELVVQSKLELPLKLKLNLIE